MRNRHDVVIEFVDAFIQSPEVTPQPMQESTEAFAQAIIGVFQSARYRTA